MTFDIGKHMEALMETNVRPGEHPVFLVKSKHHNKDFLGTVEWYESWHGYCFFPANGLVLSHDCCMEMGKFLLNRTQTSGNPG